MALYHSPRIVTDGLTLCLDAANPRSYPGTGTTWFDVSGNSNNGTLNNSPTHGTDASGSFAFDGVDQDVSLPTTVLSASAATLCMWVNVTDWNTGQSSTGRTLIRGATTFTSMIAIYNGGYAFETDTNSNPHEISGRTSGAVTSTAITAGAWFNFVLVFDSSTFSGYVNSVSAGSGAIANNLTFDNLGGASGFSTSYPAYLLGRLAAVSVYDRALTAAEIQQNFNALRGRFAL